MARDPNQRPLSNLLGLAVLSYLTQGPMHPYELQRQLRDNDAARTFKLSYGALYSVVRQLARAGLIAPSGTGRTGNRPRHTVYELTDAGRREMSAWLRDLIAEPQHEYPAFAAALSLVVVLPPEEVVGLLHTRTARVEEDRDAITQKKQEVIAAGVHPLFLVEDDFRVALLEAEMAFINDLLGTLADPDTTWTEPWRRYLAGQIPPPEGHEK